MLHIGGGAQPTFEQSRPPPLPAIPACPAPPPAPPVAEPELPPAPLDDPPSKRPEKLGESLALHATTAAKPNPIQVFLKLPVKHNHPSAARARMPSHGGVGRCRGRSQPL